MTAGIYGSPWITGVTVAVLGVWMLVVWLWRVSGCPTCPCVLWGLPVQPCLQLGLSVACVQGKGLDVAISQMTVATWLGLYGD